jgi:hypothetical protein
MKTREIILKVIFDLNEWQDYEDVCDELMIEDSGIYDSLKIGVTTEIIDNVS